MAEQTYNASSIQILEGLAAVRKRPAMYIGDTAARGLHHLVYEVVDNSIDEALAGHCTEINVTVHIDNSVSVIDNGRGIPVDNVKDKRKSGVEIVLTVLHAGGKFDNSNYKVSGGLHGVGVSCVNALSEWLEAEVRRDGYIHKMSFKRGIPDGPLEKLQKTNKTGTRITFKPDPEIFEETVYNSDTLLARLRELAFLNKNVKIVFEDERIEGEPVVMQYKGGICEYVEYINSKKTPLHRKPIYLEAKKDLVECEVAMQYTESYSENISSYANNINTHEGGTHLVGFCTALTSVVNDYARAMQRDKAKGKGRGAAKAEEFESIDGRDIRQGLYCVVSVKVPDPQFEGQTKTKLGNNNVRGIVQKVVGAKLKDCFEENPSLKNAIVEKALVAQQVRIKIKEFTDRTRKEEGKLGKFLGKLRDCSSRNRDECELFLVEGDSAGGSATQGRDRRTQAILPLRGKVLNVQKASIDRMMANQEIHSLISAIGGGYGNQPPEEGGFDVGKIRYDKVVIMTDADVDGAHIRTLLLTFFYRQMPELIRRGHLYIAQPPLYLVKKGKKARYLNTEDEKQRFLFELALDTLSVSAATAAGDREKAPLKNLLRSVRAAEERERLLHRLQRLYGVPRESALKALSLDREKRVGTEPLSPKDLKELFGTGVEFINTAQNQGDMLDGNGRSNGHAKTRRRKDGEVDLAFIKSHDFVALQGQAEALEAIGKAPYRVEDGDGQVLLETDDLMQLREHLLEVGGKGVTIQRYKGLGEMNADQLRETTMDPAKRTFLQVSAEDEAAADDMMSTLMGDVVSLRKEFIEKHALEVRNLDI
jgi:DNA gyrase subunit B